MRIYYAQNREDLLIKSFFPDVQKGFYIDVGANDPVTDSVTKLLYDEGWHGINVEPIRRHFDALKQMRSRDVTLHAGLSDKVGSLIFTEYPEGDGLSTFDPSMQEFYEAGNHEFPTAKQEKYEVPVFTLQQVIDEQRPEHIHFIKIDVEGHEAKVIAGFGWKKIRPELICIEANHVHADWQSVLVKHKYRRVFFDGINDYYLAEESLFRQDYFNYPSAVFAGNPIYYPAYLEVEAVAGQKVSERYQRLVADKERDIALLHRQQRDVRFLAKRLGSELQIRLNKRAMGVATTEHLQYKTSEEVEALLDSDSKEAILAAVHKLDGNNITKSRVMLKSKLELLGWKAASWAFNAGIRTLKKVRHGR